MSAVLRDDLQSTKHDDGVSTMALADGVAFLAICGGGGDDLSGSACAATEDEARRRAVCEWRIRRVVRSATPELAGSGTSIELLPEDFVSDPDESWTGPLVTGSGLMSGLDYRLPLGIVVPSASAASLMSSQPETLGTIWLDSVDSAAADCTDVAPAVAERAVAAVVGQDVVSRWWHDPDHREPPLPIGSDGLPGRYRAIASALATQGLVCACFEFSAAGPALLTVLSRADGSESTFGVAAGTSRSPAAVNSLCDALHARLVLQRDDHPAIDPLDLARITVGWQIGGTKLRYLQRAHLGTHTPSDPSAGRAATATWSETALARFDHEPVVVEWPATDAAGHVARVLCPGADVYRRTDRSVSFAAW